MDAQPYIVYVVDDDVRMREALRELFASLDVRSVSFGSVAEYVAYTKPDLPACLILDVELPDVNGLDFQRQLGEGCEILRASVGKPTSRGSLSAAE